MRFSGRYRNICVTFTYALFSAHYEKDRKLTKARLLHPGAFLSHQFFLPANMQKRNFQPECMTYLPCKYVNKYFSIPESTPESRIILLLQVVITGILIFGGK